MASQPLAAQLLIVPGLGDSGPTHWQSLWQALYPGARRVVQRDWDRPAFDDWMSSLDRAIAATTQPVVLAGHSLGCALIAHWALTHYRPVAIGALLVAPSDVDSPDHTPDSVRSFAPMPLGKLPLATIVVASTDDPFYSMTRARFFAESWGAGFETIGAAGHINGGSDLGDWPAGRALLDRLSRVGG